MINEKNIELFLFFFKVAEDKSIEKVVKAQNVSRSTIYRKIKELESLLGGGKLFISQAKGGVSLSPFGEDVYTEVSNMLNGINEVESRLIRLSNSESIKKAIKIVTTTAFLPTLVLHSIKKYSLKCPDISFVINTVNEEFDARKFTFDIAFFPKGDLDNKKFIVKSLGETYSAYFASREYIEKNGKPKNIDDLQKHKVLKFHVSEKQISGEIDNLFFQDQLKNTPQIVINSLLGRIYAISEGVGIANIPCKIVDMLKLDFIKIEGVPGNCWQNYAIAQKNKYNQDYIKEFYDYIVQDARDFLQT